MPPALGAYEKVPHLWPFATLYRAFGQVGIGPAQVKAMELWEAGATAGVGFPDSDEQSETATGDSMQANIEYHLARAKAAQTGEPPPPPPVPRAPDRVTGERLMHVVGKA